MLLLGTNLSPDKERRNNLEREKKYEIISRKREMLLFGTNLSPGEAGMNWSFGVHLTNALFWD